LDTAALPDIMPVVLWPGQPEVFIIVMAHDSTSLMVRGQRVQIPPSRLRQSTGYRWKFYCSYEASCVCLGFGSGWCSNETVRFKHQLSSLGDVTSSPSRD